MPTHMGQIWDILRSTFSTFWLAIYTIYTQSEKPGYLYTDGYARKGSIMQVLEKELDNQIKAKKKICIKPI